MPSYPFPTQVAVVVTMMGIHNFHLHSRLVDKAFTRVEADEDAAEVNVKCMPK